MNNDKSAPPLKDLIKQGAELLTGAVEGARRESELIAAHVLGISRLQLLIRDTAAATKDQAGQFNALISRRAAGEPLAYITGQREFYGRDFCTKPGTLVPRPETELVVDSVLELELPEQGVSFADLGTGTGCIGLTIALERSGWNGILVDISPLATETAEKNRIRLRADNARVIQGDIAAVPIRENSLDVIVSNPPYIADDDSDIEENVRKWEPSEALFSGHDGLKHIRAIIEAAPKLLKQGGVLILEHGWKQAATIRKYMTNTGFEKVFSKKDLFGLDRMTQGAYKQSRR